MRQTHEHDGDSEALCAGLGDELEADLVGDLILEGNLVKRSHPTTAESSTAAEGRSQ